MGVASSVQREEVPLHIVTGSGGDEWKNAAHGKRKVRTEAGRPIVSPPPTSAAVHRTTPPAATQRSPRYSEESGGLTGSGGVPSFSTTPTASPPVAAAPHGSGAPLGHFAPPILTPGRAARSNSNSTSWGKLAPDSILVSSAGLVAAASNRTAQGNASSALWEEGKGDAADSKGEAVERGRTLSPIEPGSPRAPSAAYFDTHPAAADVRHVPNCPDATGGSQRQHQLASTYPDSSPVRGSTPSPEHACHATKHGDDDGWSDDSTSDDGVNRTCGCANDLDMDFPSLSSTKGSWSNPRSGKLSFSESGKRIGIGFNKHALENSGPRARLAQSLDRAPDFMTQPRMTTAGNLSPTRGTNTNANELPSLAKRNSFAGGAHPTSTAAICGAAPPLPSSAFTHANQNAAGSGAAAGHHGLLFSPPEGETALSSTNNSDTLFNLSTFSAHTSEGVHSLPKSTGTHDRSSAVPTVQGSLGTQEVVTRGEDQLSFVGTSRRSSSTVVFNNSVELLDGVSAHNGETLQHGHSHRDALAQRSAGWTARGRRLTPIGSRPGELTFLAQKLSASPVLSLRGSQEAALLTARFARQAALEQLANPEGSPSVRSPLGTKSADAYVRSSTVQGSPAPPSPSKASTPHPTAAARQSTLTDTSSSLKSGTVMRASDETVTEVGSPRVSSPPVAAQESHRPVVAAAAASAPLPRVGDGSPLTQRQPLTSFAHANGERVKTHPAKPRTPGQRNKMHFLPTATMPTDGVPANIVA